MMTLFMFTTGIENSYPTIGQRRVDEMEKCKHYERWREDFALVEDLGIRFLRYGPPLHKTFFGPDRFDWEFSDLAFGQLKKQNVTPIADLCHFGVPDWIGDFQTPTSRAVRGLRQGFRSALPLGAAVHAHQRDVRLRQLSRPPTAGGTSR